MSFGCFGISRIQTLLVSMVNFYLGVRYPVLCSIGNRMADCISPPVFRLFPKMCRKLLQ